MFRSEGGDAKKTPAPTFVPGELALEPSKVAAIKSAAKTLDEVNFVEERQKGHVPRAGTTNLDAMEEEEETEEKEEEEKKTESNNAMEQ